jgi:hypothetical protein
LADGVGVTEAGSMAIVALCALFGVVLVEAHELINRSRR